MQMKSLIVCKINKYFCYYKILVMCNYLAFIQLFEFSLVVI